MEVNSFFSNVRAISSKFSWYKIFTKNTFWYATVKAIALIEAYQYATRLILCLRIHTSKISVCGDFEFRRPSFGLAVFYLLKVQGILLCEFIRESSYLNIKVQQPDRWLFFLARFSSWSVNPQVPPIITTICCDFSNFRCLNRRGINTRLDLYLSQVYLTYSPFFHPSKWEGCNGFILQDDRRHTVILAMFLTLNM